MKKLIVIVAALTLAMAALLMACAPSSFGADTQDNKVHVEATNGSGTATAGPLTIGEGQGIVVNQLVDKGSFSVQIFNEDNEQVSDLTLNERIMQVVEVEPGDYSMTVSANNATGTLDIIPGDMAALAEADEKLDDVLAEVGVDGSVASKVTGSSN